MAKIHLRKNKIDDGQTAHSVCAYKSLGNGKSVLNSRESYRNNKCVGMDEFLATPVADRYTHCDDMGLIWINSIRARKNLAPVANWAEYEAKRAAR